MYEYVWSKKRNKLVRKKKPVEHEKLVGTEEAQEVSDTTFREYIDNEYFIETEFNLRTLDKELPIKRKDRDVTVDVYLDFLDTYIGRVKMGRRPDRSYFLAAPDGFGKKHFVYQVIKEALKHGLETTKLLDSHYLYTLLEDNKYREFYEFFDGKDMAFITLGGAPSNTGLIVVKTALEYCERIGVPLVVLSRFPPENFYNRDVVTSTYLGVRASRKGDYGVMELAGFNMAGFNILRDEMRERMNLERENLRDLKK